MTELLALAWVGLIAFGVILYVILDGFDLGIGILSPFFKDKNELNLIVSTILPFWDGNQTWLVFGGAALYGAFPIAFSYVLPRIYIPIMLMVIALLLRGVAFEFLMKSVKSRKIWTSCFFIGSVFATLAQGIVLGTFVRGFDAPSILTTSAEIHQWLNPFGLFCGVALIFGYALLGSNHLIEKTMGHLQERCFKISACLQYVILFFLVVVSIWTPFLDPVLINLWFNPKYMPYLAILPALALFFFYLHWNALRKCNEVMPFWSAVGIFLVSYIGFIISSYPYLVPRHITYLQAASKPSTLLFMLIGASIMLPILLYYTYHSYSVFRGKVTEKIGY